jgi:hypothetical protein
MWRLDDFNGGGHGIVQVPAGISWSEPVRGSAVSRSPVLRDLPPARIGAAYRYPRVMGSARREVPSEEPARRDFGVGEDIEEDAPGADKAVGGCDRPRLEETGGVAGRSSVHVYRITPSIT